MKEEHIEQISIKGLVYNVENYRVDKLNPLGQMGYFFIVEHFVIYKTRLCVLA